MDVKTNAVQVSQISYSVTSNSTTGYSSTQFVDQMENLFKSMGIAYDEEEFNKLRKLTEDLNKITESNKAAGDAIKEELIKLKKKMVENMIKTVQLLNSKVFTKESWKGSMGEVQKAIKIFKTKDVTSTQLDRALRHLRQAMTRLEPATKKQEKGKEADREKALSELNKFEDENEYNLESVLQEATANGGIDIMVGAQSDAAVSDTTVFSEVI